jgi:RNA recognition motif-containing protein
VYLSRSPNSARSRGYAFVQFKDNLVARIAAEAMHGYPLGGKVLRASLVEPSKAHPDMFLNADRKWRAINWRASIRGMQAQPKDADARKKKTKKLARRRAAADEKRRAAGLDYELPATHTQVETVAEPVAAAGLKRRRADDSSAAAAPPAKIASVAASATPAPALIKSPKLASPKPVVTESSAPAPKTAKAAASAAPVPPPRPASAKKPSGPKPAALQALMTKPAGPKPSKASKK